MFCKKQLKKNIRKFPESKMKSGDNSNKKKKKFLQQNLYIYHLIFSNVL